MLTSLLRHNMRRNNDRVDGRQERTMDTNTNQPNNGNYLWEFSNTFIPNNILVVLHRVTPPNLFVVLSIIIDLKGVAVRRPFVNIVPY